MPLKLINIAPAPVANVIAVKGVRRNFYLPNYTVGSVPCLANTLPGAGANHYIIPGSYVGRLLLALIVWGFTRHHLRWVNVLHQPVGQAIDRDADDLLGRRV